MSQFSSFGLAPYLLAALDKAGIVTPTEVQKESIAPACQGKDILATAQTGTGKTFAYLLPLLTHIDANRSRVALVLVPTRELAIQVRSAIDQLCGRGNVRVGLLIGGEPIFRQIQSLKNKPQIIVGTPGRIIDHLDRKTLSLQQCSFFVLDEVDRMLDMGFSQQLASIHQNLPETVQTLMFSATMPKSIAGLAEKYLTNPHRITVGSVTQPVVNVKQDIVHTQEDEKFDCLTEELDKREGSTIIFARTKRDVENLTIKLKRKGYSVEYIHGDLRQPKRVLIVDQFRRESFCIIVATDIASRGIDVSHVTLVVNYDLPLSPEDYVHRIGRTGRAGKQGRAVSFVVPSENRQWVNIQRFMKGETYNAHVRSENGRGQSRGGYGRGNNNGGRSGGRSSYQGGNNNRYGENRRSSFGGSRDSEQGERRTSDRSYSRRDDGEFRSTRSENSRHERPARPYFERSEDAGQRSGSSSSTYGSSFSRNNNRSSDYGDRGAEGRASSFGRRRSSNSNHRISTSV
jgi:superfamily II DNA/RNA helicase